jgi:hypothetical protein
LGHFKVIQKKLGKWFSVPWYPIVISAYPVLALLAANMGQVELSAGVRSLLVAIAFGGLLFLVLWLFFRQIHKAAFLAALWLALFFSYGHVYIAIDEKYPDSAYTPWLAVVWIALLLLTLWWATRPRFTFVSAAGALNIISLCCWSWLAGS